MEQLHTPNNDNEKFSFISIAASTANVVRYLVNEKQDEHGERQTGRDGTDEERAKDHRDYVDARLRELRSWERRISGNKRPATEAAGVDQTNAGRMLAGRLK